jgi:hypothetical protein
VILDLELIREKEVEEAGMEGERGIDLVSSSSCRAGPGDLGLSVFRPMMGTLWLLEKRNC